MEGGDEAPRPELGRIQAWMQAVITHPGGVAAGAASDEARRTLDVPAGTLARVVTPSATLSAAGRLAIYSRAYHARLLECLRTAFPALLHALGGPLFDRFALGYLAACPPRSYTLLHLADQFPAHLARTRPDAGAPALEREAWPDFLVDLATLEHAFLVVYDGPGTEGRRIPGAADVAALAPAALLEARPVPAPCLRLFAFRYPVHDYVVAVRRDASPPLPGPAGCWVAVVRRRFEVRFHELDPRGHALLARLDGTTPVARALAEGEGAGPNPEAVRDWLSEWAALGFFERIEVGRTRR